MSTIIAIQQANAVHLITDAGQYDPSTGALVAIRSKVHVLNGGVAFAWRGAGGDWFDRISGALDGFDCFDDMARALPGIAAALHASASAEATDVAPSGGWVIECWLAGVCQHTGSPEVVWLTSETDPAGASPGLPFQLRAASFIVAPAPADPIVEILGRPIGAADLESLNPITDGLALIEAQRRSPQRNGHHVAGGRAELTSVWKDGMTRRHVLREWPDAIGERVTI